MKDHQKFIAGLLPVARQAGAVTLRYFRSGTGVMDKSDGSPVTLADQEAEKIIDAALKELAPDIPVVGEEAVAAGCIPDISGGRFFCVDPLDGTREFIEGGAEYSVNIALLENFRPVLGIIYAPVSGRMFYAVNGQAFVQESESQPPKPIHVRKAPPEGLTVVSSKRGKGLGSFLDLYKVHEIIRSSSAIKFCDVAEGRADLYPRLGPTSEWDTAAGEAILVAAGGTVRQLDGSLLSYGKYKERFLNPFFIAKAV
jgi:3'(2'), 5'-bisphosphate nucleotidase